MVYNKMPNVLVLKRNLNETETMKNFLNRFEIFTYNRLPQAVEVELNLYQVYSH